MQKKIHAPIQSVDYFLGLHYENEPNKNLDFNEIVRFTHDKIRVNTDEICFADEIKSVHLPTKSDFIMQVISSIKDGFIPSVWTDLVEKEKTRFSRVFLFLEVPARFELADESFADSSYPTYWLLRCNGGRSSIGVRVNNLSTIQNQRIQRLWSVCMGFSAIFKQPVFKFPLFYEELFI